MVYPENQQQRCEMIVESGQSNVSDTVILQTAKGLGYLLNGCCTVLHCILQVCPLPLLRILKRDVRRHKTT